MIICALFILACFGNLFSECKNLYDKEIKFKPNQDAKIHVFVSLSSAYIKSCRVKYFQVSTSETSPIETSFEII